MNGVRREEGLGLIVADRGVDDDVLTLIPVDRGGDAVLVTKLESWAHVGECDIRVK